MVRTCVVESPQLVASISLHTSNLRRSAEGSLLSKVCSFSHVYESNSILLHLSRDFVFSLFFFKNRQNKTYIPVDTAAVWFSFWAASGRQKQKLEPNAPLLAPLLHDALPQEAVRPLNARSGRELASVRSGAHFPRVVAHATLPRSRQAIAPPPRTHRAAGVPSPPRIVVRTANLRRAGYPTTRLISIFRRFRAPRTQPHPRRERSSPPVVVVAGTISLLGPCTISFTTAATVVH
jgi:hypothetical protein